MLKNTGPVARSLLLEIFYNVMVSAQLPRYWKVGDIVLVLKKPPRTDIKNLAQSCSSAVSRAADKDSD